MKLFRHLTHDQEVIFRQWARDNYKPFADILGVWHPVVQDECRTMNEEADLCSYCGDSHPEHGASCPVYERHKLER